MLSSWRLREKCKNLQIFAKTADFDADFMDSADFADFQKEKLMFPPWTLTVEWKLIVSFTSFKPKSVKSAKSASKSKNCKIHKIHGFHGYLHSWGLGLLLSKVFQTTDQQVTDTVLLQRLPLKLPCNSKSQWQGCKINFNKITELGHYFNKFND